MALILAADDDPDALDLVCCALRRAGHVCVTANDGAQALAVLKRLEVDAAVLDVEMPGLSGLGVVEAVRGGVQERLPIVLLSGLGSAQDRAAGLAAGADVYLVKPCDLRALGQAVGNLLTGGTSRPMSA